jgi:hypothetical protein
LRGELLRETIISSGTTSVGASAPLSGDVVVPHEPVRSGDLVLIDRFPNAVLSWIRRVSPTESRVLQLNVGTGFVANPHDYLEVTSDTAYVTRYESNAQPGRAPFDEGGDILLLDTSSREAAPTLRGRVALPTTTNAEGTVIFPRPHHMVRIDDTVFVSLERLDRTFQRGVDGAIARIDARRHSLQGLVDLPGLKNCGGIARSPSGRWLAVTCSGVFGEGLEAQRTSSGLVLFAVEGGGLVERARVRVGPQLEQRVPAPTLAFAADDVLYGVAFGDLGARLSDLLYRVTWSTAPGAAVSGVDVRPVHRPAAGGAFVFGDLWCGRNGACWLADAESYSVLLLEGQGGVRALPQPRDLPPRFLGGL